MLRVKVKLGGDSEPVRLLLQTVLMDPKATMSIKADVADITIDPQTVAEQLSDALSRLEILEAQYNKQEEASTAEEEPPPTSHLGAEPGATPPTSHPGEGTDATPPTSHPGAEPGATPPANPAAEEHGKTQQGQRRGGRGTASTVPVESHPILDEIAREAKDFPDFIKKVAQRLPLKQGTIDRTELFVAIAEIVTDNPGEIRWREIEAELAQKNVAFNTTDQLKLTQAVSRVFQPLGILALLKTLRNYKNSPWDAGKMSSIPGIKEAIKKAREMYSNYINREEYLLNRMGLSKKEGNQQAAVKKFVQSAMSDRALTGEMPPSAGKAYYEDETEYEAHKIVCASFFEEVFGETVDTMAIINEMFEKLMQ